MDKPQQINLVDEPVFSIGGSEVRPSLLEIDIHGVTHQLPPRVMQVLVTLAKTRGRVVSRNELAERCWSGRIVGEDALNRVIAKLREFGAGPAAGGFAIETVKRVGFRIIVRDDLSGRERPRVANWLATALSPQRLILTVSLILVIAIVSIAWQRLRVTTRVETPAPPVVAAASDLETRGLSEVFESTPEATTEGIGYLRQATQLMPLQAQVWGSLAMAYVLSLPLVPPEKRDDVVLRIREAAAHAQAIDAHEGRSIAALVSLEPTFGNWLIKDRQLEEALARAPPDTAPLVFQRVQFLTYVGRTHEALDLVDNLAKYSPLLPWIQAARIELLAANGRLEEAEQVAAWAGGVWPRERLVWFARFYLAAYGGDPKKAIALAAAGVPKQTARREVELAVAVAEAIETQSLGDADTIIARYRTLAPSGQGYDEQAIRAAVALGRSHDALMFATRLYASKVPPGPHALTIPRIGLDGGEERNTAILFLHPSLSLWSDPGFVNLAQRIGLADYWRRTRNPDLCRSIDSTLCSGRIRSGSFGGR